MATGLLLIRAELLKGNKVDLYYETVEDVYNKWGKKEIDVYIIEQGNGKLTEAELQALNEDKTMQVFRRAVYYLLRENSAGPEPAIFIVEK